MVHIHTKLVILPQKKWFSLHSEEVKIESFKMCNIAYNNPARVNPLLCFTVSKVFEKVHIFKVVWPQNFKFKFCNLHGPFHSLTVSETTNFLNKCSKFYISWPLGEAWVVAQGHLIK